jgi:hypothetical protein
MSRGVVALKEKLALRNKYREFYADILDESNHEIREIDGTVRWVPTTLGRWLGDRTDFNEMRIAYDRGAFTLEEYKEFFRNLGYSLSGFVEVFGDMK